MNVSFVTVGHSNHTLAEFISMVQSARIDRVVDVRKLRGSTKYPWFNAPELDSALRESDISFEHAPDLAGRRPKSTTVPSEVNAWWNNQSFHNYADHALSTEFQRALADMCERGSRHRVALMCAEAVWWRCHRRIIADHLMARGESVQHLMGVDKIVDAELSTGAVVDDAGRVTYPGEYVKSRTAVSS